MPKQSVVERLEAIVVHNSNSYNFSRDFFLIHAQWLNHFMAWGFLGKDIMLQGRLTALSTIMVWVIVGTRLTFIQSAIMELMLLE